MPKYIKGEVVDWFDNADFPYSEEIHFGLFKVVFEGTHSNEYCVLRLINTHTNREYTWLTPYSHIRKIYRIIKKYKDYYL